jgi:hypothetical protein
MNWKLGTTFSPAYQPINKPQPTQRLVEHVSMATRGRNNGNVVNKPLRSKEHNQSITRVGDSHVYDCSSV